MMFSRYNRNLACLHNKVAMIPDGYSAESPTSSYVQNQVSPNNSDSNSVCYLFQVQHYSPCLDVYQQFST